MALPFIAGLAVGAGAVVLFKNSKTIQEKLSGVLAQGKDTACSSIEKTKDLAQDVKDTVVATKECIKEKKEKIQEEAKKEVE